ncbi:bactericidal permeability-increasing protein-like isoform X1 [Mya arenaria]|uniref:bactericidal permeability-increasing protein-like isoform X1 n=2 Tax=Mya arenaria TaxID=6604 RepID=UPI0022E3896B|nr:bactericidal permeability-increasing protein-like isoform X1 [Mya arenaria]
MCWIKMGMLVRCLLLLMSLWAVVECTNPGFKARITLKGLSYANDVAMAALKKGAEMITFPDMSGQSGKFKYSVKNVRLTSFTPPTGAFTPLPGQGLQWTGSGASIRVDGDFSYKAFFVKGSGSFTASVSAVSFGIAINIGADKDGRPRMQSAKCTCSVGGVDIKFHGGMSWLYNLLKGKVENAVKKSLPPQICKLVNKSIDQDGEKKLASLPVSIKIDKYLLDYRLTGTPNFTTQYLETYHKGEFLWGSAPVESPLSPPALPTTAAADRMVYLWVSDYTFNTLAAVSHRHGILKFNVTAADLPASTRGVLNTTCDGFIPKCVGGLIPAIGKEYPNRLVDLRLASTAAPRLSITSAGLTLKASGTVELYERRPGAAAVGAFLLSLDATLTTTLDASVTKDVLHGKVHQLSLNLKTKRSDVGPVGDEFMDFLIKEALNVYLIPKINGYGTRGLPLPTTDEFNLTNSTIQYFQNAVMIATDLTYTPHVQVASPEVADGTALKYVPASGHSDKNIAIYTL